MDNKLAYVATVLSVAGILLYLKHTIDSSGGQLRGGRGLAKSAPAADPFINTQAVSQQDCKLELLPPHLATAEGASKPADYVLTTAVGYTPYQTRAFLKTFRRHNQEARIVVLVAPDQWLATRNPFCAYGRHYGVEFHSLEPSQYYPVVLLRFLAYQEMLDSLRPGSVRNILLADMRDTLFQGDPFSPEVLPAPQTAAARPGAELPYVLFSEEGDLTTRVTIRSQPANLEWGIDQGIHNFIVHYLKPHRPDLLKFEALQLPNDDSPIYTVGLIEPPRIDVSDDGFAVYNSKGVQPPIIHQGDRQAKLNNYMDVISADGI
ncbi:hypothetical protein WJX81_005701 [Elliptochloris bilobata]|uniref:Uncharacterized protein n=1 Tax=Elliptochloris bilobata TaxID=381761 RepID=A0AAW1RND4_9CHLO